MLLLLHPLLAQRLLWHREYSGTGTGPEQIEDATIDDDLNVYVTGWTRWPDYKITTIKYNVYGDTVWTDTSDVPGSGDCGKSICLDASGNVYVAGYSTDGGNGIQLVVIKYDSLGNNVWCKTEDLNTGNIYIKIAVDTDIGVYVATQKGNNPWLEKRHKDTGELIWMKSVSTSSEAFWTDIVLDAGDTIYVGGTVLGWGEDQDEWVCAAKYEPTYGFNYWFNEYEPMNSCYAIDIDNDGNLYVAGTKDKNYLTIRKLRSDNGDTFWQYTHPDRSKYSKQSAKFIEVYRPTDEVYITGYTTPNDNVITIALDCDSGDPMWTREYDVSSGDRGYELAVTDEHVYVSGYATNPNTGQDMNMMVSNLPIPLLKPMAIKYMWCGNT
jgi:hypothetical protein